MKPSLSYLGAVVVAALGYFVDVYDLVLFSVVRLPSLKDLGLSSEEIFTQGMNILNAQMLGMLLGGFLWGVWADKRGRSNVLLASILLYSTATFLNAFVTSPTQYLVLRFIAGIGLAGELGVGVTLVAELMPRHNRGIGTTIIASTGVGGALLAAVIVHYTDWRWAYGIGGMLGFLLLLLRVQVSESKLFTKSPSTSSFRGNIKLLLWSRERFFRYLKCILVGLPTWYTIGVLVTFSPEIGKALGAAEEVSAASGIFYAYLGLVFGDLASGVLSQFWQSRKKAIVLFLALHGATALLYLTIQSPSPALYHILALPLGFAVGYWAVFITTASELFGTNIRATVTTTVPNMVRGSTVLVTSFFHWGASYLGAANSALVVGTLCLVCAVIATIRLPESFHRELD